MHIAGFFMSVFTPPGLDLNTANILALHPSLPELGQSHYYQHMHHFFTRFTVKYKDRIDSRVLRKMSAKFLQCKIYSAENHLCKIVEY